MRRSVTYVATLLTFLVLDAIWLTSTTSIYRSQLGELLIPTVRILPAISFYLLQVLGIQIFVLPRAGHVPGALAFGAGFGIFTYATYDLTNWAVMKDWSFSITAMDITWGAIVTALASAAGCVVKNRQAKPAN